MIHHPGNLSVGSTHCFLQHCPAPDIFLLTVVCTCYAVIYSNRREAAGFSSIGRTHVNMTCRTLHQSSPCWSGGAAMLNSDMAYCYYLANAHCHTRVCSHFNGWLRNHDVLTHTLFLHLLSHSCLVCTFARTQSFSDTWNCASPRPDLWHGPLLFPPLGRPRDSWRKWLSYTHHFPTSTCSSAEVTPLWPLCAFISF